jgi:hypothetical protein
LSGVRSETQFSEQGGHSVILQEPPANGNLEETMTATNKIDAIGWLRNPALGRSPQD